MALSYGDRTIYQNSGRRQAYGDGYTDTRHLQEQSGYGDREVHKSMYESRHSIPSEDNTNLKTRPPHDPNSKCGHTYRSGRISHFNLERNEGKNLSSKFLIYGGRDNNPPNEDFHRENAHYRNPQQSQAFTHAPSENMERLKDDLNSKLKNTTESFWNVYQENPTAARTTYPNEGKLYPERENHINRPENPEFYEELLKECSKTPEQQERILKPPHHRKDHPDRYDFPTTNNKATERAPNAVNHGWPNRWNDRRFLEMVRRFPPPSSHNFSPHQIKLNRRFPSNSSCNPGSRPSLMDWISSSSRNSLVDQLYLHSASKNSLELQPPNNVTNNTNNSFLSPANAKVRSWKNGPQQWPNPSDTISKYRDMAINGSSKLDHPHPDKASNSPWGDSHSGDVSFRKSPSLLFSPNGNSERQIQVVNPARSRPVSPHFPKQTSETHASFKNPLELTRKFQKNQTQSEIPIIPCLTESQASYQNPYEPRKLPLGYPDKTTSHFVRSSLAPSVRRDQRNSNEQQQQSFSASRTSLPPSRLIPDPKSNHMIGYARSRHDMQKNPYLTSYCRSGSTAIPAQSQCQQHSDCEEGGIFYPPRLHSINNSRDIVHSSYTERKQDEDANHFSREPEKSSSRQALLRNASGDCDKNKEWHQQNYFPRGSSENNFDRFNTASHPTPPLMNSTRQEEEDTRAGSRVSYPYWNSPERTYLPNESTQRKACENNHESSPGPSQHERMKQEQDRGSKNCSTSQVRAESLERYSGNPLRANISARNNLPEVTPMNARPNCQSSPKGESPSSTLKASTATGTRLARHPELRAADRAANRPLSNAPIPIRERMSFRGDNNRSESTRPSRNRQVGRLKPILKQPRNPQIPNGLPPVEDSLKYVPLKIMLFCKKGIISIPSPSDVIPNSNSFSRPKELITLNKDSSHGGGDQRRHSFTVNMEGFLDQDIYLFMDKSKTKLVVEGRRPKRENINARRLVESIDLPRGLSPDNLRVARDYKGILHFEQAWVF